MTTYLPAERVEKAIALRDAVTGPEPVLALWRKWANVCDEGKDHEGRERPTSEHFLPLSGPPTEPMRKLTISLLRRAGAQNVTDSDDMWRLLHKWRISDLITALKEHLGMPADDYDKHEWAKKKALARPIPGLDTLPFELSKSQRSYIDKVRSDLKTTLEITGHDAETGAVTIRVTTGRGRYQRSWRKMLQRQFSR